MNDVVNQLESSVEIVKRWGETRLPNGKLLSEHLTFDGFSFWELIEPVLALYYVPNGLSDQSPPLLFGRFRPHISLLKKNALNLKEKYKVNNDNIRFFNNQQPFLFLGFNGYMFRDVLQPVAQFLAENKNQQSIVIFDESRRYPMHENLIKQKTIWSFYDEQLKDEVKNLRRKMKYAISELFEMNAYALILEKERKTLWPRLKNIFNWIFNYHFPLLIPQVIIAMRVLKEYEPPVIISVDFAADPRKRIYSILGHKLGIPILEVQFGAISEESVESRFLSANKIATWGCNNKNFLMGHGILEKKIAITGSPRHDSLVHIDNEEISKIRTRLGIPEQSLMVLCASTYQQKEYEGLWDGGLLTSMKKAVFEISGKNIFLVIKPHPLEDVKNTKKLVPKSATTIIVNAVESISELAKACDIFLSFGTTATFDALIANKLVVCPSFPGWIWSDIFINSNAVLVPRSISEINNIFNDITEAKLQKLKDDLLPAREIFLENWVFKADGNSSERVSNIALKMSTS